jgi:hypothetical protein
VLEALETMWQVRFSQLFFKNLLACGLKISFLTRPERWTAIAARRAGAL